MRHIPRNGSDNDHVHTPCWQLGVIEHNKGACRRDYNRALVIVGSVRTICQGDVCDQIVRCRLSGH